MTNHVAVLICGYNDINSIRNILNNPYIRALKGLYIHIDGPKFDKIQDIKKNKDIKHMIETHDMRHKIIVKYSNKNLGIRYAIPQAVDWVLQSNDRVIVLEDDVLPGPNLFPFMEFYLNRYEEDMEIGAISGYTQVPKHALGSSKLQIARLSIFPESYVWATWKNRWIFYQDNLLLLSVYRNIRKTKNITLSRVGALAWRLNFVNAQNLYVDSWAYRWVASLWEVQKKTVVPNFNLTEYCGTKNRTHTKIKNKWCELPIEKDLIHFTSDNLYYDFSADSYSSKQFFHGSVMRILELVLISIIYRLLRVFRNLKK